MLKALRIGSEVIDKGLLGFGGPKSEITIPATATYVYSSLTSAPDG
jgi:hypothetical protein